MADVVMPRLSDSMEEGTVVRWLKSPGDKVRRGDEIVEIETDKATLSYEADSDGILAIVARAGSTLPVGATIATITEPGADPVARPSAARQAVAASPVARRAAARLAVDLATVPGSGPRGRILKRDVIAARGTPTDDAPTAVLATPELDLAAPAPPTPVVPESGEPSAPTDRAGTRVELSRIQRTVARRMSESSSTVPDFALQVDVDMRAALALREELRAATDPVPTVNDLLVKAAAATLRRHPRVNGAFRGDHVEQFARVNVGLAVATDAGLVVPTVLDADRLPLGLLAAEARRLVQGARAGTLTPAELDGGTFTVSNLGMLGIDRFAGIVNPPQAAILCAGAIVRRPIVDADDSIVAAPCLTLTLVADHRILDGADGAPFLADLRAGLERPLSVLV